MPAVFTMGRAVLSPAFDKWARLKNLAWDFLHCFTTH